MSDDNEKIPVIAFDYVDSGNPLILRESELQSVFDEIRTAIQYGEPGDRYTIEVREMTEAEIQALPEWDGF